MAQQTIKAGSTHAIRADKFHDARDPANLLDPENPTEFLDAATLKTADVFDVTVAATPVAIGSTLALVADGSGGGYGVDLPHDFGSGALVPKLRIKIVSKLEEGGVHWETPTEDQFYVVE